MDTKTKRLKYACCSCNVTMAVAANLSPLLFVTFRSLYGISYSLLGLLACAFTGLCTSMLWPGSLAVASDRFPDAGLFICAFMAARAVPVDIVSRPMIK